LLRDKLVGEIDAELRSFADRLQSHSILPFSEFVGRLGELLTQGHQGGAEDQINHRLWIDQRQRRFTLLQPAVADRIPGIEPGDIDVLADPVDQPLQRLTLAGPTPEDIAGVDADVHQRRRRDTLQGDVGSGERGLNQALRENNLPPSEPVEAGMLAGRRDPDGDVCVGVRSEFFYYHMIHDRRQSDIGAEHLLGGLTHSQELARHMAELVSSEEALQIVIAQVDRAWDLKNRFYQQFLPLQAPTLSP
jgi:hypothetical protein